MFNKYIYKGWYSLILIIMVEMGTTNLLGQGMTIVNVVSATEKDPLIGAAIIPVGQSDPAGWLTDINGTAQIDIQKPTQMEISYVGFLKSTIQIAPGETITIELKEDVLGLEEVVVTGAFAPTTSSRSLYTVKKLDAAVIEARGAVNLGDVLQTQLNLKTIQDDVLGTRVVMQGISGPNVKMLIDGIPLVNGTGGEFDLGQINMNNVERVEIVEGPLSVQYGTNALAGTINIITKDYGPDEFKVNTSAYYESVGQYNFDLALAKGWEKTSLSIGGARNQFEGYSSTGERKENWIPKVQYLANAKLKTRIKTLNLTTAIDRLWQNATSHGNATSAFNNRTNKLSEIATDNDIHTNRLNGAVTLEGKLAEKHYLNLVNGVSKFEQGSQKYIQDVVDDLRWLSSEVEDHDTTSFTTWTFRGTYVYGEEEGVHVTAGYEASLNSAEGGRISADADGNVNEYGLFTAVEIPVGSRLKVQPALRYTFNNSYDTKEINFLDTGLPILPSLNLLYANEKKLEVRLSYGQGYRTPSVRELYYEFIDANHYIVGNSELQPEVGYNLSGSANLRKSYGRLTFAITPSVFFSRIDNKIDLIQIIDRSTLPKEVPKNVPVARVYENIPNFKSYGFNLSTQFAWSNKINFSPGFGLLARSGSEADDNFYNSYEVNLNGYYFFKKLDTRFNIFYKYNGQISEFARNQDGSIGVLTLADYHTLDLSLSKPFWGDRLFTTVGAKNIFNVTDISLQGEGSKGLVLQTGREAFYPISWGRTFFIKINYSIK